MSEKEEKKQEKSASEPSGKAAKNDKKKKSRFGGLSDYLRKRKEGEIEDGG